MKIYILLAMIFLHIIADYNLQGWLATAKQKDWWTQQFKDQPKYLQLYKYDYIIALFMHSFCWTFLVMLIPMLYSYFYSFHNLTTITILISFISNLIIHMYVDDAKANLKLLNLVTDQILHLIQIILIWGIFICN